MCNPPPLSDCDLQYKSYKLIFFTNTVSFIPFISLPECTLNDGREFCNELYMYKIYPTPNLTPVPLSIHEQKQDTPLLILFES